jgi:hypothetical protein
MTGTDKAHAFMPVWLEMDLRAAWRKFGAVPMRQAKFRASRTGELHEKFLEGATIGEL